MFSIWLYMTRKSDIRTTIIDLVNQDTLLLHTATFTMFYIMMALLYSMPTGTPSSVILLFSLLFNVVVQICYMYYSIGIAIRYFLVMRQRTYLSEDHTDKEIQQRIRFTSGFISFITVFIRSTLGDFPQFYYDMLNIEGKDQSGMLIIILLLLFAILINIICRVLIHIEKTKFCKDTDFLNTRSVLAFFVLAVTILTMCILYINRHLFEESYSIIKLIWAALALNVKPSIFIILTPNFFNTVRQRIGIKPSPVHPKQINCTL